MKTIEAFKVGNGLSSLLVNIQSELKSNSEITLKEFCNKQNNHPLTILNSVGFNALVAFSALVPLKETLEHKDFGDGWRELRIARNALCHGSYDFLDDGRIEFVDDTGKVCLDPRKIIDLSNKAFSIYTEKYSNKAIVRG